jgi:hypothetical protein
MPAKYPLRDMQVGETRMFPGVDADHIAKRYSMYRPMQFMSKTIQLKGVVTAKTTRIA